MGLEWNTDEKLQNRDEVSRLLLAHPEAVGESSNFWGKKVKGFKIL